MTINSSTIIMIIVVAFAFYLIYSQNNQPKIVQSPQNRETHQISNFKSPLSQQPIHISVPCPKCNHDIHNESHTHDMHHPMSPLSNNYSERSKHSTPQVTNVMIEQDTDPYSDPIKKQDLYSMNDPLTYPQMRLPREILDKYNDYYEKNGTYPGFNQHTQPMFDNPILNGLLIKQVEENEPFTDNIPNSIPLFRVKSAKNTNRFFYYILDQRYSSKFELKIPLDNIKVNKVRYNQGDFYGIPELYDGDIIENIAIYPSSKFKILLYKTYHFP
ncbi:hypothetical protein QLL95_gp0871 [Cotonvirus japonicus]|uniref:Uncharacterized protein n=1 Tax=Cotonvirus japonicus TaxID=2811091 RepID=A0ABM7NSW6_9VIRU|nr:hypothetical protein QLL95_gp0871 [Cotonvirus japonicus]BCS83252.1 hypothetical protein [Cotonvirus japonicus]